MNTNDKEQLKQLIEAKINNELELLECVELNKLIDEAMGVEEIDMVDIEPVDSESATGI